MTNLPKVSSEELYKSLYEKASNDSKELREQVATMEILAAKLRDERDTSSNKLNEALEVIAQRDELLRSLRESEGSEPTETIEGVVLED